MVRDSEEVITGIYLILYNGIPYIGKAGGSKGFKGRWKGHKKLLKANRHKNHHLQNIYNKHGIEVFTFVVHTRITKGVMTDEEFHKLLYQEERRIWLSYPKTLNSDEPSGNGAGIPSFRTRRKISIKSKARMNTPEAKAFVSKLHKNKKVSEETRKILSENALKQMRTPQARKRMSEVHKGRKLTQEHKDKISRASKGNKSRKGMKNSEESNLRRRIATLKRYEDPKERERTGLTSKGKLLGSKNPMYGKPAWNRGKKHSERTKRRIRAALKKLSD